jgi:hypothetical protein
MGRALCALLTGIWSPKREEGGMMKRLLRWLPLLAALVALMAWNEARSVDYVTAHIECPKSLTSKQHFPDKIGSDPPFYPGTRNPLEAVYASATIRRHGQRVECHYTLEQGHGYEGYRGYLYFYNVQRQIMSCEQKSPRALDCLVQNK